MSNPLIANKKDDGKLLAGAGFADTGEDLVKHFTEGKKIDPIALGIDSAAMVLDVAGLLTDPLGTLASSVVGWIIENVGFIREPFDKLAGDPPAIEAVGNTWENIAKRLREEATTYSNQAKSLADWTGDAADAYRTRCSTLVAQLEGSSAAASSAANKIKVAGAIVAATRALIRDLLADLAGTLLMWGIPAAASAIPTAGASIAAFITRAVTKAVEIGTKIARFVAKLFKALDKLGSLAKSAGDAMRRQADELAALSRQMPNSRYGNQRAAELASDSATKVSRADTLDNVGEGLGNASRRVQDGVDNAMNKVDDLAQRTSRKVQEDVGVKGHHQRWLALAWLTLCLYGAAFLLLFLRTQDEPCWPTGPSGKRQAERGLGCPEHQRHRRTATADFGDTDRADSRPRPALALRQAGGRFHDRHRRRRLA